MTAPAPARRFPLLSALIALAIGIIIGIAGMFGLTSVVGQEPAAQATTPAEVLEYGTR